METHKVTATYDTGLHFVADAPGGTINIDGAEEFGGQGLGNRAKPLMLTALSGCTGMDVASLMKKMRVDVDDFKVEVSGELTDEHPKKYKTVKVDYYFTGKDLDHAKLEKAVKLSVERYCGVYEMFRHFADISYEIHYTEK